MRLKTVNESIASKEYVIWGVPKGMKEETLLISKFDGRTITDKAVADRLAKILVDKHGCTNVRIQEIDLTDHKINFGK